MEKSWVQRHVPNHSAGEHRLEDPRDSVASLAGQWAPSSVRDHDSKTKTKHKNKKQIKNLENDIGKFLTLISDLNTYSNMHAYLHTTCIYHHHQQQTKGIRWAREMVSPYGVPAANPADLNLNPGLQERTSFFWSCPLSTICTGVLPRTHSMNKMCL